MVSVSVSATYGLVCGDELCEFDETFPDSSFYCPADCETTCSGLGYIMPPECLGYGYHLECDSCCADCTGFDECDSCCADCVGVDGSSRSTVYDYCEGYGYIRPDECVGGECTVADCGLLGMVDEDEFGYECPACENGDGYDRCDSCCPQPVDEGFPWWLLAIGFVAGYYYKKSKR